MQLAVETRVGLQPRRELLARLASLENAAVPPAAVLSAVNATTKPSPPTLTASSNGRSFEPGVLRQRRPADAGAVQQMGEQHAREGVEAPPEAAVVRVDGAELVADDALDDRPRTRAASPATDSSIPPG